MKTKTTLISTAIIALAMSAWILSPIPPARADVGTSTISITNTLALSATQTANLGSAVKIDNAEYLGVVFKGQQAGTGTEAITINFSRSADGTTYETTPLLSAGFAANGATAIVGFTNLPITAIGAAGWIKVLSIQNANTNAVTNCALVLIQKRVR